MNLIFLTNIYLWIVSTLFFLMLFILTFIFIIVIGKKTHAMIEFKAWLKGSPICLFFKESRYCEWKALIPEAGIITDKNYGAYIINERATYVDRKTKAVLIPFDASIGTSINIHAAKLIDDLQYIIKDDEEMKKLRYAIGHNMIEENESITCLKTSINLGAVKNMMTALIPHNINAKIEKVIASRMSGFGKVNIVQIIFLFVAIFGAILLGALIIYLTFGKA